MAVDTQRRGMKWTADRIATRWPRALSAVFAIPVMRSDTTSGTIVILSPSSQTPPTLSARATASEMPPSPRRVHPAPSASPATSADNMSQLLAIRPLSSCLPKREALCFDALPTEYPIAQNPNPRAVFATPWRLLHFQGESKIDDSTKPAASMPYLDHLIDIRSEEHTSELQSLMRISYAVFCLKKKKKKQRTQLTT